MSGPYPRLLGLETEYGLSVDGRGPGELLDEARALVRATPGPWAAPWDYRFESPRRDLRGFEVERLTIDEEDARFDGVGAAARMSAAEQRSDRVLPTGARFYNDHGHPEYSTPECRAPRALAAADRAGERWVLECARRRAAETGREVRIYKNNTDFHGSSYGCHENYLVRRSLPFDRLLAGLLPFLVTRQIYAGAGKTGVEAGATDGPFGRETLYQLSQRADFFTEIASADTLARRPLFNTRDEPHADPSRFRRLHVICGDASMSPWATAVKTGAAAAVLDLLEEGWEPLVRLRDPLHAVRYVSRDPSLRWVLELEDGRTMRGPDLQRVYLSEARLRLSGRNEETDWLLGEWAAVLDDLERDPLDTDDRVDWAAKRRLLETYLEAEGIWWESPVLRSLDLEYHNLDPEFGLYAALEQAGQMRPVLPADGAEPPAGGPEDTRAGLRGALVRHFSESIRSVSWEWLFIDRGEELVRVRLPAELAPEAEGAGSLLTRLKAAKTPEEERSLLLEWLDGGGADASGTG